MIDLKEVAEYIDLAAANASSVDRKKINSRREINRI